ncbi:MAG TPA: type II toxin-antitoxin system RelE/ParE family toxin [Spirochaetota bacterium]|nr:type II toxin-antitoxin system RelE/ParE family toxin [Spirochaetota bacterium]HPI13676.1 type II toxin-antitoxin system RelE/ParE family toxin [Spirochaetota bacterium]HPO46931.1 type II toxin-antitoxin system RelE/ParE family toxin [Spirochaetota bacterium]HPV97058.1 type II toxin-antitoxin system RelE/ParE family toxin [Spirochaetota bacterium]
MAPHEPLRIGSSRLWLYSIENYRVIIISTWRMIYRIEGSNVYIVALFDGRRNFEDILLRRIIRE